MERENKLQVEYQPTKEEILEKLKKENKDGDEYDRYNLRKAQKFYRLGIVFALLVFGVIGIIMDNVLIIVSIVAANSMGTAFQYFAEYHYKKTKGRLIWALLFAIMVLVLCVMMILNMCGVIGKK